MADEHRLDVWISKTNRVYPSVPFKVVGDRVQQGRLRAEDRVRPAGTATWHRLADYPLLSPYLARPVPFRAEDQAEALEPVEMEISWKRPSDQEEDDPDMIPLIDISLVLLVFFMMTAGSLIVASAVETPPAENARVRVVQPRETITISLASDGNQVRYFLGDDAVQALGETELVSAVAQKVREGTAVEAVVKANPWVPYETVRDLLVQLESVGVKRIQAGVREKRSDEEQP